jgi:broad specificity phosphatase PhoE
LTTRVLLVSPAISSALREARFGGGSEDDLDAAGLRQAEAGREAVRDLPLAARMYVSPSRRCRRTAEVLGLDAEAVSGLAPWTMGRWQGRTLAEVAAEEPAPVRTWLSDPASAPHGGETLLALHDRVGHWLDTLDGAGDEQANDAGRRGQVVCVAEPDIVRATTVHALGADPRVFWRIDVRPLSVTELTARDGRWNLLGGRPLRTGPR